MSKAQYITGLRAVEQILATESTDIRRIYAEYQTANPRVEAIIKAARQNHIEIQPANRARLMQISGESRHQGVVAEALAREGVFARWRSVATDSFSTRPTTSP